MSDEVKDDWVLMWNMDDVPFGEMRPAGMRVWMAAAASLRPGDQRIERPEALAVWMEASIETARRGLRELEQRGVVQRDPGGGRYIPEELAYMARREEVE